ncbi:MAG: cytochrome P450 [Myxococcales bacterium]|nr:cytochrome P450 [Myxococcales bacterium]
MQVQNLVDRALRRTPRTPSGLKTPPLLSGGLPILGHTVEFVRSAIELLTRAQRELGEVAAVEVGGRRMVALFGPDAQEAVFRAPDAQLNPKDAYKIMTPVFGEGMVYDAPDDKMAEQMKMLVPALKDKRMRTYGETILQEVLDSMKEWGDSGELDLVEYCRVLTNYTSSACLLGHEFRHGMTEEFARVYHDMERGVTPLAYLNANLPIPSFRKRDKARVRLVEMITEIVEQRRKSGKRGEDFLQTLMDARYKSGEALTEDEITGMLLAAMFAGHHTSSVTTAWTLIELLQNPAYLGKLMAQLDEVYGDDGLVTYQSLRQISLTENAVKEALRLHPPLFMLVRVVQYDFVYKGYLLPRGTWVLISPTVAHLIGDVFAEPERFDPDRFAPPREEDKRDFAYIPFGGGRHKCLGNAFALLQVKAIVAVLLRQYEFELVGDEVGSDFHGLVVGPKEPMRLRYRRRDRNVQVAVGNAADEVDQAAGREDDHRRLRVMIDRDLCQGHAVCIEEAPEIFSLAEDGRVELKVREVKGDLCAKADMASRYCPNGVIRVEEVAVEAEPKPDGGNGKPSGEAGGCPFH